MNNKYSEWYEKNRERINEKKRIAMRKYRKERPEHYAAQSRAAKVRQKEKLFDIYGRVCVLCGFNDIRALTLDHVLNNGAEERKAIGERGVYSRALLPQYREEYRTLCMNCQWIQKRINGRLN